MSKKVLKLSLILFFLTFTSYNFSNGNNSSILFPIKNISVNDNPMINQNLFAHKFENVRGKSLLLLNKKDLKYLKKEFDEIKDFNVKKIYPNTLKITLIEKKPIAVLIKEKKKFIITKEGEVINFNKNFDLIKLPFVFGNHKEFSTLFKILKNLNFDTKKIAAYYYFEIGRWDLKLINDKTIKLPAKNYEISIKEYIKIQNDENFANYEIFDYRIKDQLILN